MLFSSFTSKCIINYSIYPPKPLPPPPIKELKFLQTLVFWGKGHPILLWIFKGILNHISSRVKCKFYLGFMLGSTERIKNLKGLDPEAKAWALQEFMLAKTQWTIKTMLPYELQNNLQIIILSYSTSIYWLLTCLKHLAMFG